MIRKLVFNVRTLEDAQDFIYQCIKRDIQVWRCATWEFIKKIPALSLKTTGLSMEVNLSM